MIDIHCHILPDLDDGASSLEESIAMARMAAASGVTGIVATPHFPGEAATLKQLPALMEQFDLLYQAIAAEQIPLKLYRGAEILCLPETSHLAARQALPTIGDTNYLLTEFFFDAAPSYINDMLSTLTRAGYRPVVAHPERYGAVQRDMGLMEYWFRQGYVLQLNKGSLLGAFGPRVQDTTQRIIDLGLAHLIASDAHSAQRRTPHMGALQKWAEQQCSPDYARILLEYNPARLVEGRDMVPAG